jgi:hypothetical protein
VGHGNGSTGQDGKLSKATLLELLSAAANAEFIPSRQLFSWHQFGPFLVESIVQNRVWLPRTFYPDRTVERLRRIRSVDAKRNRCARLQPVFLDARAESCVPTKFIRIQAQRCHD